MCWYCAKWERGSPETFARWVAFARGGGNSRDAGLLRAPRRSFGGELGLSKMKRRKRRRYASSNEEHSFNFNREPAMFEEDGSMIAWCFIHCCWEEWRQVINDD